MWVLGIESGSSRSAISAVSPRVTSPAPKNFYFYSCGCVCLYMCKPHAGGSPQETRRGHQGSLGDVGAGNQNWDLEKQ